MYLGRSINYRIFESKTYDNQKIHLRTSQIELQISLNMLNYEEIRQNQYLIQISSVSLSKNYGYKDQNKYYKPLLIHDYQSIVAYSESTFLQ